MSAERERREAAETGLAEARKLVFERLDPRTKTPIPKTLTACQAAFEEPNDACAPTAGAEEKRPRTAVGETHQRQRDIEDTSPNATLVTFVSAVISPQARSRDTETLGKSSIAVFICAEIGSFDRLRSTKLCTFSPPKTLRAS